MTGASVDAVQSDPVASGRRDVDAAGSRETVGNFLTPPSVHRLLRRCLERDRRQRLPDIGSARLELDEALTTTGTRSDAHTAPVVREKGWQRAAPWAITAVAVAGAVATLMLAPSWRSTVPTSLVRLAADLGADVSLAVSGPAAANLALSPDGRLLTFVGLDRSSGTTRLFLRPLDRLEATALSGTEGARDPFFSPYGEWLGFFADGKLKKVAITGGAVVPLADAPDARGGTWSEAGTIVFTPAGGPATGLHVVSDRGGVPEPLIPLTAEELSQRWPQMLPGGRAVLYTSSRFGGGAYDNAEIVVQTLPNGPRTVLQRGGYFGRYVSSGHLLYVHRGTLFAAAFDLARLQVTGAPVPVVEGVSSSIGNGATRVAVSDTGTLVYLPRGLESTELPIAWVDREGKIAPLRPASADWSNPAFSPDGTRLAMDIVGGSNSAVVRVYDWARDTLERLTFDTTAGFKPVWTPDGRRIVFSSSRTATPKLFWQRVDGTGAAQQLTDGAGAEMAGSWHPKKGLLAFQRSAEGGAGGTIDIFLLEVEGDEASGWKPGKTTAFLNTPATETEPMFSPDGRWLAYVSNETGLPEVFVTSYPGPRGKWQVSEGGGSYPAWSEKRPELFYATPDNQIMGVSYSAEGDSFRPDKPRPALPRRFLPRPRLRSFALHPDGNRFAMAPAPESDEPAGADRIVVVVNFGEELRRLAVPSGR